MDKYYKEEISEKIRLLYVALSRAKEKMIIVGDFSDPKSKKESLKDTRSFYDLVKFSENKLSKYYKNIDLKDYDLTENYKIFNNIKHLESSNKTKIINKTININKELIESATKFLIESILVLEIPNLFIALIVVDFLSFIYSRDIFCQYLIPNFVSNLSLSCAKYGCSITISRPLMFLENVCILIVSIAKQP